MCWMSSEKPVRKKADEDIKAFKVVRKLPEIHGKFVYSPYYLYGKGVVYEEGKKAKRIRIRIERFLDRYAINQGYHSYQENHLWAINGNYIIIKNVSENKNFYTKETIMKCIIPKGTYYYVNKHGEYVSESIIPTSFEEL